MKPIVALITILFGLAAALAAQDKMDIAVFDLDAGPGVGDGDAQGISEILRTYLSNTGVFRLVERSKIDDMVGDHRV